MTSVTCDLCVEDTCFKLLELILIVKISDESEEWF